MFMPSFLFASLLIFVWKFLVASVDIDTSFGDSDGLKETGSKKR